MTSLQALDPTVSIESLIPHRPPMQLLDRVIAAGPQRLLACAELTPDAPFCSAAGVPACIGLEYLGQAAAAFFSTQASADATARSTTPHPGMLIASRSYVCQDGFFPPSQHLLIDVAPASTVGLSGLVKFRGSIYVLNAGEALHSGLLETLCEFLKTAAPFAQGDLSVYLPPSHQSADQTPT